MTLRFHSSDFQINKFDPVGDGLLGQQDFTQSTVLSDGRFAVVYQSEFKGGQFDFDPIATTYNANGTLSSISYLDLFDQPLAQGRPVVAALPGGGFGVAFTNDLHANASVDPHPSNITYVRVAADGTAGTPLAIGDFGSGNGHDELSEPQIATLSSGCQVIVFERTFSPDPDLSYDVFLNVVSADGLTTQFNSSFPFQVANTVANESSPAVAAIGNSALVAYEDTTGTTQASANITARLFDGTTNTAGPAITIADHSAELHSPKIAPLDDHRYVIVYSDFVNLFGRIYDTSGGGSLSSEFEIDQPGGISILPAVAATADGGFVAAWTEQVVGNGSDILARRFNSDGQAMGRPFTVNRVTQSGQFTPSVSVSGVSALFGWSDNFAWPTDTSGDSVRGQVMSLTTEPDFNNNGISDVLWRGSDGSLVAWDMNKSGALGGSAAVTSGGVAAKPDASWSIAGITDFSGDGRADVLWRNANGALVEWLMNGSTIGLSQTVTSGGVALAPDASWSVAAYGDFDGDGKSDLVWRNGTTGQLTEWRMNGGALIDSTTLNAGGVAAAPNADWSVAAVGDFDGDGKTDLLWRNGATGELSEWQMNGASITNSAPVTFGGAPATPGPSWSVAGVGDFNADGNADILWRDSSGSLVEWLMNGANIIGNGPVTAGGASVAPDASWHLVEIGDFNGDARADMLWRSDDGALAEWMMKGSTITASDTPSFGGSAVAPGADWQVQARPTIAA
jgi:hypothetical protein